MSRRAATATLASPQNCACGPSAGRLGRARRGGDHGALRGGGALAAASSAPVAARGGRTGPNL